jgi:hypothetical protein
MTELMEFKARQMVQRMHQLTTQVDSFTRQAKMLQGLSNAIDARVMLQEGNLLLNSLMASRREFETIDSQVNPTVRSLSSRPSNGRPAPAAQWNNELRAGTKRFLMSVQTAEQSLKPLYSGAMAQMNAPGRTSTEAETITDAVLVMIDVVTRCMECLRRPAK